MSIPYLGGGFGGGYHWHDDGGTGDGSPDQHDLEHWVSGHHKSDPKNARHEVLEEMARGQESPEMRKCRLECEQKEKELSARVDEKMTEMIRKRREFRITPDMARGTATGLFGDDEE